MYKTNHMQSIEQISMWEVFSSIMSLNQHSIWEQLEEKSVPNFRTDTIDNLVLSWKEGSEAMKMRLEFISYKIQGFQWQPGHTQTGLLSYRD